MVTLASFYGDKDTHGLRDIALPLPYLLDEIQRTLENQSSQAEPTGQITFSQIGQIRPLPYALVVMLNLDTGKFPNRETHIPFDLMEQLRQQLGIVHVWRMIRVPFRCRGIGKISRVVVL